MASGRIMNEFPFSGPRVTIHQRVNYGNEMCIIRMSTIHGHGIGPTLPRTPRIKVSLATLALRTSPTSDSQHPDREAPTTFAMILFSGQGESMLSRENGLPVCN